jgi:hypothetical protein
VKYKSRCFHVKELHDFLKPFPLTVSSAQYQQIMLETAPSSSAQHDSTGAASASDAEASEAAETQYSDQEQEVSFENDWERQRSLLIGERTLGVCSEMSPDTSRLDTERQHRHETFLKTASSCALFPMPASWSSTSVSCSPDMEYQTLLHLRIESKRTCQCTCAQSNSASMLCLLHPFSYP